jgi:ribose 5-phosphate isomerase A
VSDDPPQRAGSPEKGVAMEKRDQTTGADRDRQKRAAATAAVAEVADGMLLGLGSGSTAAFAIEALAARIARDGLRVSGVPTSERTAALARRLGIPLAPLAKGRAIDLTIDGADEVERGTLHLIKGLGGALLREKVVASASRRVVIVVDEAKLVERLGTRASLPVEVVPFAQALVEDRLASAGLVPGLRMAGGAPFQTDGGNIILDCAVEPIADPMALERRLDAMVGVVESGLFLGMAARAYVGVAEGVRVLDRLPR